MAPFFFFSLHSIQPDTSKANDKMKHDITLLEGTIKSPTDNVSIKGCPSFSKYITIACD